MRLHVWRLPLVLLFALSLAACRQPDGTMPVAEGEVPNRLSDISRDLMGVARGDAESPNDLADDLAVFADAPAAQEDVNELSRRTAAVLAGKTLTEQNAQRLAHHLWVATSAQELSQRQIETLQNDVQTLLVSMGVPEDQATNVGAQVGEVQEAVSTRPRRWYEFF